MKNYLLFAVLVISGMSCSKEGVVSSPSTEVDFTAESLFVPAYISDDNAQLIKVNQPIILTYLSKKTGTVGFVIKEGNTVLTTVNAINDGASKNVYYQIGFPTTFLIPENWSEKVITITVNDGTSAFTKYRVAKVN